MRKLIFMLCMGALVLVGCSSGASENNGSASSEGGNEEFLIKLGHTGNTDHHYQEISERFAELVNERTDGNVTVEIYPSDQLGEQSESVEGVMIGTQDMVLTSDGVISNWVPDMGIINLPFLFENTDQVSNALNSEPGKKLEEQVEEHGAVILGWWQNGFRHVTNSKKEIETPSDLNGLKIRVPETEISIAAFEAMGASPTPISFNELYSALQLGTVDAQENPPAHILTQKFYEVQDYVSRTGHIYQSEPLLINKDLLESLPEEYQKVLKDTAKELESEHSKIVNDLEDEQWEEIEEQGMVITDVDKEPFIEVVQPVYDEYRDILDKEIIDEILEMNED